jgi:hypothetical protein
MWAILTVSPFWAKAPKEHAAKAAAVIKRVANFIQVLQRCKSKQHQPNPNQASMRSGFAPKRYRQRDSTDAKVAFCHKLGNT